jgi:hypothetical protein
MKFAAGRDSYERVRLSSADNASVLKYPWVCSTTSVVLKEGDALYWDVAVNCTVVVGGIRVFVGGGLIQSKKFESFADTHSGGGG